MVPGSAQFPVMVPGSALFPVVVPGSALFPAVVLGSALFPEVVPRSALFPVVVLGSAVFPVVVLGSVLFPAVAPESALFAVSVYVPFGTKPHDTSTFCSSPATTSDWFLYHRRGCTVLNTSNFELFSSFFMRSVTSDGFPGQSKFTFINSFVYMYITYTTDTND